MVEDQEPRLASRNRKADIRKMMKLAEGTGKRRLAALIGPETTMIRSAPRRKNSFVKTGVLSRSSSEARATSYVSCAQTSFERSPPSGWRQLSQAARNGRQ
jgi:hypothetical protein